MGPLSMETPKSDSMDCVERVYTECLEMCILNMASSAA